MVDFTDLIFPFCNFEGKPQVSSLLVVVFSLVLDCENRHNIQGWFKTVQGKVASGSKVDHKLTKIVIIFHRPANHVGMFERHK